MSRKVLISCGEPSGDLYAGALASELLRLDPTLTVTGLGGERLRAAGATILGTYDGLSVTGLFEAAAVLPRVYRMYRRLVAAARADRPDVFVAIDFPDFNFRLAGAMRRLGVPVVYYVSPQLWAWRAGRMRTLRRIATKVLVIFPFEEPIYRDADVPVEFVGHPLMDLAVPTEARASFRSSHQLASDAPCIALLPGSRPNELRSILPDLLRAAELIVRDLPAAQFVIARAPGLDDRLFAPARRTIGTRPPAIVAGRADDVLAACDIVLTASGTATVQAAIHERPMVIVYRLSPLTYRLGKPFVHVETYGMVNLVAGRRIALELIQDDFTPEAVAREALRLLRDSAAASAARAALRDVKQRLGGTGASARAAAAVLRIASSRPSGAVSATPP